ncbi:hydrogenase expression/formation protein HypE [Anaerolinea thermophila]|nr:hydrogenase expression/formation protein HypE [Anaerolinea thermophila]
MNDSNNLQSLPEYEGLACPLPLPHNDQIVIGHGSGGKMTHDLIRKVFQKYLSSPALLAGNDFASLVLPQLSEQQGTLIVSTDSHVVFPLFFPGGDIGRLAVAGTVNDVAVSGGIPLYLTASFILEEGFPVSLLEKILASMQQTAEEAGVVFIAGDTKVVERGKMDGVFINTTGLGWLPSNVNIHGANAQPGDVVILSGSMGDHGMAILTARGELGIQSAIESDVAPLNHLIRHLLEAAPNTHVLRDPTRGGVATTLNEIALQSRVGILLEENALPVKPVVRSMCEMLGFDPLYIANEGKVLAIVPEQEAQPALDALRSHPLGSQAQVIGKVITEQPGKVLMRTLIGSTRIVESLSGEILPRIC